MFSHDGEHYEECVQFEHQHEEHTYRYRCIQHRLPIPVLLPPHQHIQIYTTEENTTALPRQPCSVWTICQCISNIPRPGQPSTVLCRRRRAVLVYEHVFCGRYPVRIHSRWVESPQDSPAPLFYWTIESFLKFIGNIFFYWFLLVIYIVRCNS